MTKIPRFPVYLFDVDGTLIDSAPDICGAIQTVLANHGRHDVSDTLLRSYIGRHLDDTFGDLGFPQEQWADLLAEYRGIYAGRKHAATRRYDGVMEAIAGLGRESRKSTATTKGTPTTRIVLEMFGLIDHFDHVQGTDGFPAKPEPDVILKSLEHFGVPDPKDCLMVGDAWTDMEAGRKAGVKLCAVRYGYGKPEDLARYEPEYWIDDLRDLL